MDQTLRQTWNDVASRWDDYASPLRPYAEDLRITREHLSRWQREAHIDNARVFLCGVTPEIATMDWPFPVELTAMDQAESMVQKVWPGDIPGVRRALVGNW